ncbi:unnamed protein product [Agarophyton chilense]
MLVSHAALGGLFFCSLLTLISSHPVSKICASTCDFQLCNPGKLSLLSPPFTPITPPICLEGRPVHVSSTGEAFVRSGASYYSLISRSGPSSKRCAPNFFNTYPTSSGAAAIGYEPSRGTDYSYIAGKCIALPLNTVQLVSPTGLVLYEMELEGRPLKDCVGFEVSPDIPPPPSAVEYEAVSATLPTTPSMQAEGSEDVSNGARSALNARKRIMNSLGPKSYPKKHEESAPTPKAVVVEPIATDPSMEEMMMDEEPMMSAEPMEEPDEAPSPSEESVDEQVGGNTEIVTSIPLGV